MTLWMISATLATFLLALSALALERALRSLGRPARWAWALAMAGALIMLAGSLVPDAPEASGPVPASVGVVTPTPTPRWHSRIETAVTLAAARTRPADPWLAVGWPLASAFLVICLAGELLRLRQRAEWWRPFHVVGHDVVVSDDFGPALVGLRRPTIVIPRHLLSLPRDRIRMACDHEAEHKAAGDHWLLAAAAVLVVAVPWNTALWWMAARLRAGVEIDCDRRVLRRGARASSYARLLLDVARRDSGAAMLAPGFVRGVSPLERRMTMIVHGYRRMGTLATWGSVTAAMALSVVACEMPLAETTHAIRGDGSDAPEVAVNRERPWPAPIAPGSEPLLYVDGVRIGPSLSADVRALLDGMDPESIESIEVVKGPAAASLYGDEASAGIIRIVTKTTDG